MSAKHFHERSINMSMRNIYRKIARENGVSVEEVKREMQAAINAAYKNPSPQSAMQQCAIPKTGKVPTTDELIRYVVAEACKKQ